MIQDWFFDLLIKETGKIIEELRQWRYNNIVDHITDTSWYNRFLPQPYRSKPRFAAVDGGSISEPLLGGGALLIARAIAIGPDGGISSRRLRVKASRFRSSAFLDFMRSILEYEVAMDVLDRLKPGDYLLMDGSLLATLYRIFTRIARIASGRSRLNIGEIEADMLGLKLLPLIAELLENANSKSVRVLYVSKDFSFRILKEHILLRELDRLYECESNPSPLCIYVRENMNTYPAKRRELLLSVLHRLGVYRSIGEALLNTTYRDQAFVDDIASHTPGFTSPLVTGLLHTFVQRVFSSYGIRGIIDIIASRLEIYFGEKLDDSLLNEITKAIRSLPAVNIVYLKPRASDPPIMIEYPYWDEYFITRDTRYLREPGVLDEEAIGFVASEYKSIAYYNTWLIRAHSLVRIKRDHIRSYIRFLENSLAQEGVELPLSRRTIIKSVQL